MAKEVVSGVGANAKRTDKNISSRVSKIQRDAKIQQASGGAYGQRQDLQSIASSAPMAQQPAMPTGMAPQQPTINLPSTDIFAPGTSGQPLSHGAPGGPGAGPEVLQTPVDAADQTSVLVRAMYLANPTPQLRRMVEAFNQEGR